MDSLILIGMPGAGKSTVGVLLAKALGMDFLDSDLLICRRAGCTLQQYLDRAGLEAFLDLEEKVIRDISLDRTVLATGGSVPLRERAMEHLRPQGRFVYLEVPLPELKRRIQNISTRGIAFRPGETLSELYNSRTPVYRRWADITVSGDDMERVVENILNAVKAGGK